MNRPAEQYLDGLQNFSGALFLPGTGADGTGTGGIGVPWFPGTGAAATNPAPTTTNLATQLKRTIYASGGAAQELGPRLNNAADFQWWRGNANVAVVGFPTIVYAGLGGFYFCATFMIEAWNNNAGRLFVGMSASANPICLQDLAGVPANTFGLYHDTADGANILSYVHCPSTGPPNATKALAIAGATLAAGQAFRWEMWHFPNSDSITNLCMRLTSVNTGAKIYYNSFGGGGATIAAMLGPQCQMSPGADAVAGHFSIGVANILCTASNPTG